MLGGRTPCERVLRSRIEKLNFHLSWAVILLQLFQLAPPPPTDRRVSASIMNSISATLHDLVSVHINYLNQKARQLLPHGILERAPLPAAIKGILFFLQSFRINNVYGKNHTIQK